MHETKDGYQLEVLISTCNERILTLPVLLKSLPQNVGVVIVHQQFSSTLSQPALETIVQLQAMPNVKLIQSDQPGLARSRNLALSAASASLVIIADDDIKYLPQAFDRIMQAAEQLPQASAITFRFINEHGQHRKRYPDGIIQRSYRNFFKVSSVELVLRREALLRSKVRFDERFGLGAQYPVSEENIFLVDLHRAGEPIYFYPADILMHPYETSGGNWDLGYLHARGALFKRVFGWLGLPLLMVFLLKHRKVIRAQSGIFPGMSEAVKSFMRFAS